MKHQRGFTLIELLVVIAIIGILTSVVLPQLSANRAKSRDAVRMQEMDAIQKSLESYYLQHRRYPSHVTHSSEPVQFGAGDNGWDDSDLGLFIPALEGNNVRGDSVSGVYMRDMPDDPLGSDGQNAICGPHGYWYHTFNNQQNYVLVTRLETPRPDSEFLCDSLQGSLPTNAARAGSIHSNCSNGHATYPDDTAICYVDSLGRK